MKIKRKRQSKKEKSENKTMIYCGFNSLVAHAG